MPRRLIHYLVTHYTNFSMLCWNILVQLQSTIFSLHFSPHHHFKIFPWKELLLSDNENHKEISRDWCFYCSKGSGYTRQSEVLHHPGEAQFLCIVFLDDLPWLSLLKVCYHKLLYLPVNFRRTKSCSPQKNKLRILFTIWTQIWI